MSASSTSSEDLENLIDGNNRGFVDVVIDPLPKSVKESSEDETECGQESRQIQSPRKSSLGPRLPVIPPSSVKITSDGNLAGKLEALTGQAEAKLKQMALEEQRCGSESQSKPPLNPMKIIPEKRYEKFLDNFFIFFPMLTKLLKFEMRAKKISAEVIRSFSI